MMRTKKRSITAILCILLMAIGAAQAQFAVVNGDFETGEIDVAGGVTDVPDVSLWYDQTAGNFWASAWQLNRGGGVSPNGSTVVVFSANNLGDDANDLLTGSYIYQGIGTSSGESAVGIAFEWGHPDDTGTDRVDGMTVSVWAGDGSFDPNDDLDLLDANGVTLLDSASYEHTALGTDGEMFPVVVALDISDANEGDTIYLRFNNTANWPCLDNVTIAPVAAMVVENVDGLMGFEPQMMARLETLGYAVETVNGDDVKSGDFSVEMAEAFDVIVVSEAISSSDVTSLAGADVPMMNGEGYGWHKMNYAESDGSASWQDANDLVDVVSDSHPIILDANLAMGTMEFLMDENAVTTTASVASLAPGAESLVSMTIGDVEYTLVFAIDEGAELAKEAGVAANRIVGFSLPGNDDVNNVLSDFGWALFDAAIRWLDPAFAVENGDFEVGAGAGDNENVSVWYDDSSENFWDSAWELDRSGVTPNGTMGVVFSGLTTDPNDALAGSYVYQPIGTSSGEAAIAVAFEWGHPDDTGEGRTDGVSVSLYAGDGSFDPNDGVDVRDAEGITLLDSASYEHTALGTDGEIFAEVVVLDMSAASAGDVIYLRFNNTAEWPFLDNVAILYTVQD